MGKVSLLSLGCPKNLVDSENLLRKLREKGICYSSSPEESDIIMINTCGFIESAKKESIEEILKLARLKEKYRDKKLVVFGCLAKRYADELKIEIPEIDAIWGIGEDERIVEYCRKITEKKRQIDSSLEKMSYSFSILPGISYSYLKIAEGCDRGCSYCVIPDIRGGYRSRDPKHILKEAGEMIASGVKELILIAQDITAYGKDIKGYSLSRLIKDIASIKGDFWIRLLYLFPTSINDELLETIIAEEKVCNYIDMPLQHSEDKILKLMGRGGSREYFEKLISKIRDVIPDVTLRTTFIVGFPHETEKDFNELLKFIRNIRFDRLGVFTYSREEGSTAYKMKGQMPELIKIERHNRVMEIQSAISLEKNKRLIGKRFRALTDEVEDNIAITRLYSQAPDIDGVVLIKNTDIKQGSFVDVKITEAYDYDLKGEILR